MSDGWAPLVENLAEAEEPVEVVARFLDLPHLLFLDSATGATARSEVHPLGRYSFLSADPSILIRCRSGHTEIGPPGGERRHEPGDPLVAVREILRPYAADAVSGLPPFQGGSRATSATITDPSSSDFPRRGTTISPFPRCFLGSTTGSSRGTIGWGPRGRSRRACLRSGRGASTERRSDSRWYGKDSPDPQPLALSDQPSAISHQPSTISVPLPPHRTP